MKYISTIILSLLLAACGGGGSNSGSKPPPKTDPIQVSISPAADQSVAAGGSIVFKATVSNSTNTAVTWLVDNVVGGNEGLGTITPAGVYTAPKVPPTGGAVTVTAVSQADSSASASATVTIGFGNASLSGNYIFSFSGQSSAGAFAVLGRLHADGQGNVSGVEDYNGPDGVFADATVAGSYNVGPEGTGTLTLSAAHGPTTARFVIFNATTAELVEFDGSAHAVGQMLAQTDFSGLDVSLDNNYFIFDLSGSGAGSVQTAIVGQLHIVNGGLDIEGRLDRVDNGVVDPDAAISGVLTFDNSGRGTVTVNQDSGTNQGTINYRLYAVSDSEFELLSIKSGVVLSGDASQQLSVAATGSVSGNYVFDSVGESSRGDFAAAGRFVSDGQGHITSGIEDRNDAGTVTGSQAFTGSYTVDSDGRGEMTLSGGAGTFTFYTISNDESVWLETDGITASGNAFSQADTFATDLVKGHFGFLSAAVEGSSPVVAAGVFTADGTGKFDGFEMADEAGTLLPDLSLMGTYTVDSNGRGTIAAITNGGATSHYVIYGIAPQLYVLLGTDAGTPSVGLVDQQY